MKKFAAIFAAAAAAAAPALCAAQGVTESDAADAAIERGLAYLASVQNPDGSFPHNHGKGGSISALSGMAFLSKGYVPGAGKYGREIEKCVDFVLSVVNPTNGFFGAAAPGNEKMYTHSICTLFLEEVSGMVDPARQARLDELLPKAVQLILDAQNIRKGERDAGGWRYQLNSSDSDMSCSGWALMALRSARLNGGRVPGDAIERALAYVKRQRNAAEGSFTYQGSGGGYTVTLTGAGILCVELCGRHNDPDAVKAARYLMRVYRELLNQGNRSYGMYYTAQGLFQMGGESWQTFEDWMYRTWIPRQRDNGSWSEEEGSPPYNTALLVLAFAVPYRQLPIYQRDETVDED